jgi:hypothetical protein
MKNIDVARLPDGSNALIIASGIDGRPAGSSFFLILTNSVLLPLYLSFGSNADVVAALRSR